MVLEMADQAAALAENLDQEFRRIGHKVHVIINYDNFDVLPPARPTFFAMIKHNEQYALSRTRYSTNAFFRRRLGRQFAEAKLQHRLYGSFADARAVLDRDRVDSYSPSEVDTLLPAAGDRATTSRPVPAVPVPAPHTSTKE
jgi:hypothetical protein